MNLEKVRHLNPKLSTQVLFLASEAGTKIVLTPHALKDFDSVLKEHEKKLIKKCGYNSVLRNLPQMAEDKSGQKVVVTYANVIETLRQFGKVDSFKVVSGTVYIKFKDFKVATNFKNIVNNMMIGNNIVHVDVF
jgi:hypothetical protein